MPKSLDLPLGDLIRLAVEQTDAVVYVYRLQPPGFAYVSPAVTRIVGYSPEEHYADPELGLKIVHEDDRPALEAARSGTDAAPLMLRWRHKDGRIVWTEQRNAVVRAPDGAPLVVVGAARDITGQHEAVRALGRHARFYVALSEVNDAVARGVDEAEILGTLCRSAVEHGALVGATVRTVGAGAPTLSVSAGAGFDGAGWRGAPVSVDPAAPEGQGPTSEAVRTGRSMVSNNVMGDPRVAPWHAVSREYGVEAVAAVPLVRTGQVAGAITFYAAEAGYFDDELVALLERLVSVAARGLDALDDRRHADAAEAALRASEARYRELFDLCPDPMWVYDVETLAFLDVNEAAVVRYGYSRAEFLAMTIADIRPHEDVPALKMALAARAGQRRFSIWRHRTKSGRALDVEIGAAGLTFRGRAAEIVVARDRTHEIRAGRELRASEERFRAVFESAVDAVFLADADGRAIAGNQPAADLFGIRREEMAGVSLEGLAPARQPDGSSSASVIGGIVAATLADGHAEREVRLAGAAGREFDAAVRMTRANVGDAPLLQIAVRDLTERKRQEAERAALEQELAQAQKMDLVGRLAGGVAHDFNNLLTVIEGHASLLAEDAVPGSPEGAQAREILAATARAAELTRKLLVFSRRHPDEPRVVAIDAFLEQEMPTLGRLIGEHIAVQVTAGAAGAHVKVDPARLSQVLINLVVNARDAMPEGGRLSIATGLEMVARAEAAEPRSSVVVSVADTGCGMSAEAQAHLFEPFFTTKAVGRGTGLGLATSYAIVRRAGGSIDVESAPGAGTTVRVRLPVVGRPQPGAAPETAAAAVTAGARTVLLVEDEPAVLRLTTVVLERLGYRTTPAASPDHALELARNGLRPDLVITDMVMPGMSGLKLVEALRAVLPPFEVLYMSGFANTEVAGADEVFSDPAHFITKPFTKAALAAKIDALFA